MARKSVSRQESFASDLAGTNLGIALYSPIPFGSPLPSWVTSSLSLPEFNNHVPDLRNNSGKVGDVAFFDSTGTYRWLRNAFHTTVRFLLIDLIIGITGMELAKVQRLGNHSFK
jgi:hypothetical protein